MSVRRRRQYNFSVKNYRLEFRCFSKSHEIVIGTVQKAHIDFWTFSGEITVALETPTIIKTIKFLFFTCRDQRLFYLTPFPAPNVLPLRIRILDRSNGARNTVVKLLLYCYCSGKPNKNFMAFEKHVAMIWKKKILTWTLTISKHAPAIYVFLYDKGGLSF